MSWFLRYFTTTPVLSNGALQNPLCDVSGNMRVAVAATVGATAGAATNNSRIISAAATTNATSAKASAGTLYHATAYNAAATARYLKFYNKASAPTVGTDTPTHTFYMPPTTAFRFDWPNGFTFATGIAYALTTGGADADTGALTAADVLALNVEYA